MTGSVIGPSNSHSRKWVLLSAYFLAAILLFSGIDKLLHYDRFLRAVESYRLLPAGSERFVAPDIVFAEILISAGLMFSRTRRRSSLFCSALLTVFTAAYVFGEAHPAICGCSYTITLATTTPMHIAQNVIFIALSLFVWHASKGQLTLANLPAQLPSLGGTPHVT